MINKDTIIKNFSDYASFYDQYASVQRLCAEQLIQLIKKEEFSSILDIGCGTGYYTQLLRSRFPAASITALDFSAKMLEIANESLQNLKVDFLLGDAESMNLSEQYDLVTSNVSFQWFEHLEEDFLKYKQYLKQNGVFLFSMFGPKTFFELNESIRELLGREQVLVANEFKDQQFLESNLRKNFPKVCVTESYLSEKCDSVNALLQKIKYTGARGEGLPSAHIWTPRMMKSLDEIYRKKFGEIIVTYQVFWGMSQV